ncbi:MAG: exopolysaccharide Pel transporter PelG [Gammaproteobacteria bacterium]
MAGIGFELRKLLENGSYFGVLQAYGFAGLISAGPWVLSIFAVFAIGLFRTEPAGSDMSMQQFQISVTYLIVFSFLLTSPVQLSFSRFLADRLFKNQESDVFSNVVGVLTLVFFVSGSFGTVVLLRFFDGPITYRLLMLSGLVLFSGVWMVMTILSCVRDYVKILLAFLIGHGTSVGSSFALREFGLEGFLSGYVIGQALLFFFLLALVVRRFPSNKLIALTFLRRGEFYPKLALTGVLFAFGIWADKLIFWFNPLTSVTVIEPLRVSEIYDLPIFLAYLCIIPGMASLFVRFETDFAEKHEAFYSSLNKGASLDSIMELRDEMILSVRRGLNEICKIQGITAVIFMAIGDRVLDWAGISPLYRILLNIDIVAVSVQVLLLALFNAFSYFDLQSVMVKLSMFFVASNVFLTALTQYLGPVFYGYGFATALIMTSLIGLVVLSRKLDRVVYRTYMLQKAYL